MTSPSQKPDLDESINVTEAHGRMVRETGAAAREHRIADNGTEPVSLGVVIACGFVLLIAGAVLGDAGTLFSYKTTFRDGYVRSSAEGAADTGPQPKPALDAFMAKGAKIYSSKCNGCHGADAKGDGANYPSLVGSKWVIEDTQTLAMVILNGLQGPISTGKTYGPGMMPPQGIGMSPEDLAGVMTYVRNNFGNSTGDVTTVEMAQAAIDISGSREKVGSAVTAEEIAAAHATMLPGDPLDPTALVNPGNLAPAEAAP